MTESMWWVAFTGVFVFLVGCSGGGSESRTEQTSSNISGLSIVESFEITTCHGTPASRCESCKSLLDDVDGFGRETTGGIDGKIYVVTSLEDQPEDPQPGTLRHALIQEEALWILFAVSGRIDIQPSRASTSMRFQSNKTIDGRGQRIEIFGQALSPNFKNLNQFTENIIIHNLIFLGGEYIGTGDPDAISAKGVRQMWIDHNSFQPYPDEVIDISINGAGRLSDFITISNNYFAPQDFFSNDERTKSILIVGPLADSARETGDVRVTIHQNFFDQPVQRSPKAAQGAMVHAYNNYLREWDYYGMSSNTDAQLFAESNIFESGESIDGIVNHLPTNDPPGYVKATNQNNLLINEVLIEDYFPEVVFDPKRYYSYTAEPANESLAARIASNAGWRQAPLPRCHLSSQ